MLVAVLSDIHDNIWNLEKILARLREAGVLIFCGDFCAPFTLKMMAEGFSGPVHCVLGNNDGDVLLLTQIAAQAGNVRLYNPLGEISLEGKELAFAHYPEIGAGLAARGKYSAVFCGHTHQHRSEKIGATLLLNPGEVMGRFGHPSYVFYDTETGNFSLEEIP